MDYARARRHMIDSQVRPAHVTDLRVVAAMETLPRELFAPPERRPVAYADEAIKTSEGRWMLAPRDLAKLLAAAEIRPVDAVLDVASGAGYTAAAAGRLAETVVGIEADEGLASAAEDRLRAAGVDNAAIIVGNVAAGAPKQGPFDVVLIAGGVESEPASLRDQLADGGRLVFVLRRGPVGQATVVTRSGDYFGARAVFDCQAPVLPEFVRQKSFVF